jgi:hypothetical protein
MKKDVKVSEAKNLMRRKRIQLEHAKEYDEAIVTLKQKVGAGARRIGDGSREMKLNADPTESPGRHPRGTTTAGTKSSQLMGGMGTKERLLQALDRPFLPSGRCS